MKKILYLAPEHYTGTLGLFVQAHRRMGNDCRLVTLFRSRSQYPEDICLHLPLVGPNSYWMHVRRLVYSWHGQKGEYSVRKGYPPVWEPANRAEDMFFRIRDALWAPLIHRAIEKYKLLDFDIYHLESGLGFFRDARIIRQLKTSGKKIVCSYHGTDIRQRGIIPDIDRLSDLNLTCELDLLSKHPRMKYLFLPIDTSQFTLREPREKVRYIGHAPTSRYFKGSDTIIQVCRQLEEERGIQLILIEKKSHKEALRLKARCDIFIDQISNLGGWGYGMNSLESLAMGIPTCTNMVPEYREFLPDHPFVHLDGDHLKEQLMELIMNARLRKEKGRQGREWVERHHDIQVVIGQLYGYYEQMGWLEGENQRAR
jgi:glycosyltransferase involved in cell wall biosynthesis